MKTPILEHEVAPDALEAALAGAGDGGFNNHGRVVVLDNEIQVADTYYDPVDLYLLSGNVKSDRLAETRRSGTLSFEVLTEDGFNYTDPLQGFEFVPMVGVETEDNIVWMEMGRLFVVGITHLSGTGRQKVSCQVVDGSTRYRENPWTEPFETTDGTGVTHEDMIREIIADRTNNWIVDIVGELSSTVDGPVGMKFGTENDPWAAVWKLAQSAGGEVFHDRHGVVHIQDIQVTGERAPALEIYGDQYSITAGDANRALKREEVFNGVICRASAPWLLFPVEDEVWDTDASSITYYLGDFGKRPKIIEDPLVTSTAQCLTMAEAEYERIAGIRSAVTLSILKDPTLETGSTIRILQGGPLLEGLYTLDSFGIGLLNMKMDLNMRKKL